MTINNKRWKILVVEDSDVCFQRLLQIFGDQYDLIRAKSGEEALELITGAPTDLILLDVVLPKIDGFKVMDILRKSGIETPIIFITEVSDHSHITGLEFGACDYINKPFVENIARLRVENQLQILQHIRTIKKLSTTDMLTNLPNRRAFDERFQNEWSRALRKRETFSVLKLDVDNLKNFNDTHGHLRGDEALATVAKVLKSNLRRSSDYASRWGGEEFIILLPMTDDAGALFIAEKIRIAIEKTVIFVDASLDPPEVKTTVSVGAFTLIPTKTDSPLAFIRSADNALYEAKTNGRNRVIFGKPS
ncbi:MAG: diguanylate cyclase [Oscillospiraceae bacterium]|nr:diguanylate cyclase [Oscillospiraceae bacterium]